MVNWSLYTSYKMMCAIEQTPTDELRHQELYRLYSTILGLLPYVAQPVGSDPLGVIRHRIARAMEQVESLGRTHDVQTFRWYL